MLTPVQHNDELLQQFLWDAQSNKLTLRSSMMGICSNTLTQRGMALFQLHRDYIPAALGVSSSYPGPAFELPRTCILAPLGQHSSCMVCIAAALGLHSSCTGPAF